MSTAQETYGTVFKQSSAVLLARIVGADAEAIVQADVTAIRYSILKLRECQPDVSEAIAGHDDVALTVSEVVFDTLQTDDLWSADVVGYNFRHELDVSTDEAFPTAGVSYQVRYEVTPVSGQKIVFRFVLRAI